MRLIAYFLVIAALVAVVGFVGFNVTNATGQEFNEVAEETIPVIEALGDLRFSGIKMVAATKGIIAASQAEKAQEEKELKGAKEFYDKSFIKYEDLINRFSLEEKDLLEKIRASGERLKKTSSDVIKFKAGEFPEGEVLEAGGFETAAQNFLKNINQALASEKEKFAERKEDVESAIATAKNIILVAVIITIILSIGLGLFISARITKPLEALSKTVDEVSKGNFKVEIKKTSSFKEINMLADSLSRVMKTMKLAVMEKGPEKKEKK